MSDYERDGAGRNFQGLSVRETQEALAEELDAVVDETEDDEPMDAGDADAPDAEDAAAEAPDAPPVAVFSAREEAEQLRMLEALLFASGDAQDIAALARRLPEGADVKGLLEALRGQYENRGVVLSNAGGKWRFVTAPDVAHVLEIEKVEPKKLSRAALETLAIIAYHQPCTRADIEDVRGVAVSKGSLDQLMEMGWVRLRGRRRDAPGRPVLYGTTAAFLEHFNLDSVSDLPGMADLKAAGLLDARLPPGFQVPTPTDGVDDDADDDATDGAPEFVQDFHDAGETDPAAADPGFDDDAGLA